MSRWDKISDDQIVAAMEDIAVNGLRSKLHKFRYYYLLYKGIAMPTKYTIVRASEIAGFGLIEHKGFSATEARRFLEKRKFQVHDIRDGPVWPDKKADESSEEVDYSLDGPDLRADALRSGVKNPETALVLTKVYRRSSKLSAYAKKEAGGTCDLCEKQAPFSVNGIPFLEAHHVKQLAFDGSDTVDNVVALCPNCHRKVHRLKLPNDIRKLQQRIASREAKYSDSTS